MTEKLLQFIWRYRYFNQQGLRLFSGEPILIDDPGIVNPDQGPDFLNAKIRIDGVQWIGSVELHLFSSGWEKHGHDRDAHYRNVILHVVWMDDLEQPVAGIPQLELHQHISGLMLNRYQTWMNARTPIACDGSLLQAGFPGWTDWMSRLLQERLERKSRELICSLKEGLFHWEEQCWQRLAWGFGLRVNAAAFESVARSIPLNLLSKHRENRIQIEALLFGQSNLLNHSPGEDYLIRLQQEYSFLKRKYRLKKVYEPMFFLRMRPEHFPTIRLSQLAGLFTKSSNLFFYFCRCGTLKELRQSLQTNADEYWRTHYVFGKLSKPHPVTLSNGMIDLLIINSVIPLLYTYGKFHTEINMTGKIMRWMAEIGGEKNSLLTPWLKRGTPIRSAADSQALLELSKHYCLKKNCLNCDVGKWLLKQGDSSLSGY
ncbi:MAG TPA: DUF2851 family protein [Puia sp.]|nr:DUF2851 family protein [Puia sp.]